LHTLSGQVPIGLVVLKAEAKRHDDELVSELVQMVREQMGAIACFKQAVVVERLPKTRSGKILRGTMRRIADGQEYRIPSTIDDADILGEIEDAVGTIGYGKK
jgi:propionyl-CoA synthetase